MSKKDWLFSAVWASALLAPLVVMVVGPQAFASMDVQQVLGLLSAKPGAAAGMVLFSLFGGVALHGRFTVRFTKSK